MIVRSLENENKQKNVLYIVIKALSVQPHTVSLSAGNNPVTKSKLCLTLYSNILFSVD